MDDVAVGRYDDETGEMHMTTGNVAAEHARLEWQSDRRRQSLRDDSETRTTMMRFWRRRRWWTKFGCCSYDEDDGEVRELRAAG